MHPCQNAQARWAATFLLTASASLGACSGSEPFEPVIVLSPAALDFGAVHVGAHLEMSVRVENAGDAPVRLSVQPSLDSNIFAPSLDIREVATASAAVLTVRFTPQRAGDVSGQLQLTASGVESKTLTLSLQGAGVDAVLLASPADLDFKNVVVGSSKALSIELRNTSAAQLHVAPMTGTHVGACVDDRPRRFCTRIPGGVVNLDGSFDVAPGQVLSLELVFSPQVPDSLEQASMTLISCSGPGCSTEIRATGRGVRAGLSCAPPTVDFGPVSPGSCSTRAVDCDNVANLPIAVEAWAPSPTTASDFQIQASVPQTLAAGQSLSIDVTYCPTDPGEDGGSLNLQTSEGVLNFPLSGSGSGADIEVAPSVLDFGLGSVNAPARRSLLITNLGLETLEISELVLLEGSGVFSAPGASATTLAPGDSYTITVEFSPLIIGPVEDQLSIRSNDADTPELRIRLIGEGVQLGDCIFEARPSALNFGTVEQRRARQMAFEVRNIGGEACLLTGVRMEPGSDSAFSLPADDQRPVFINPGAAVGIAVTVTPETTGTLTGAVEFSVSSPTSPFNRVPVAARSTESTLLAVPKDLNFGVLGVGCAARPKTVQLYNGASIPAVVSRIATSTASNPAFTVFIPAPLPNGSLTVAPGDSAEFEVGFATDRESDFTGTVLISAEYDGQPASYVVGLFGRASDDVRRVDRFRSLPRRKVDVLFVVDNSSSMAEEQASLTVNFASFMQYTQALALDYQIAVTTTDVSPSGAGGRLLPLSGPAADRVVTPASLPSPEAAFASLVAVGTSGSSNEQGIEASLSAITSSTARAHNAGFVRQGAVLSLIFVSDEPDFSPGSLTDYVNAFLAVKGFRNTNLFSASAIVGDSPGGCNGPGGSAAPGRRYVELANRTGGLFQSICTTDWGRAFEQVSLAVFGFRSRYFLSAVPILNSLTVTIDSVDLPRTASGGTINWSYDYRTNSINFTPFAVPEPDVDVVVRYDTSECL